MAYNDYDGTAHVRGMRAGELPGRLWACAIWMPSAVTSRPLTPQPAKIRRAFDPTKATLDDEVTIVVNDAQESFGTTTWCITVGVTILGGVLAYFVSGRALKPLRDFAAQVERVQPDNLSEIRLSEDVPTELQRCSASFNDMIGRLDEGFSAQRQFTGNAAHELRTPLALMQAQIELFVSEHPTSQPQTAELLDLLQEETERMSRMTKVLLEMSELRSFPARTILSLAPCPKKSSPTSLRLPSIKTSPSIAVEAL